ncbi:hypothetical protein KC19_2G059400 [Ceratodon purpureus]|uniref:Uncharacterized protein n=1 Tax=Ceratodon purpureus TaxID=3225 RepID=A0A8T0ISL1_CERPU|nr:hypothetical protein KC19_2G059400 [Ceratodon purpureus]
MTKELQGVTSLDTIMAERINCIDVKFSEPAEDADYFLQKFYGSQKPERSPSQDSEDSQPEDSPQRPVLEAQPPNNSSQQQNSQAAKPQSRKSNRISFTEGSTNDREADQDKASLLHSLILVYADAGAGGLSIQEAVRRIRKLGLPGLKEKGNTVQVANIANNHPDFVAFGGIGCFMLRRPLLKSFRSGALDVEEYADEKKMETLVLEKYYASNSPKSVSMVQLPLPVPLSQSRVPTPANQKLPIGIHRRNSPVPRTPGHRQPV